MRERRIHMLRTSKFSLLLCILLNVAAYAEQNGAAASADGSSWHASKDCSLKLLAGEFVITSIGEDPYIVSDPVSVSNGPFTVELRAKSNSRGPAQIFWSAGDKTEFAQSHSVDFVLLNDNEWHDYHVKINATDMGRLRFDPSNASGECRVAFIHIKDKSRALVKDWNLGSGGPAKEIPNANGNAQIRGPFKDAEIVITTTARLAGAIHSLTWHGKEFIDSNDHGRQLQSATNLDCATGLSNETFNPTEAGSRDDGTGEFSSSKLLSISAQGAELKTTIQMAFWLHPGEKSGGVPAKNTTVLSNHLVTKCVHIGHGALPNVIEYDATFTIPDEHHNHGVIEACTGYMPAEFKSFYTVNPKTGELATLSDGPGEQPLPVILATENGSHAMGIFAPAKQPRRTEKIGYGRFRFRAEKVVKWNCVFRLNEPAGIAAGDYLYHMFVVVGTLDDVKNSLSALEKEFAE